MTPTLNLDAATLSPIALFLSADWLVKLVMAGLLIASIWSWTIIVTSWRKLAKVKRESARFERDFWAAEDIDAFHKKEAAANLPAARVMGAGLAEWRNSTARGAIDRTATRDRLATAMGAAVGQEVDVLSDRLNVLATIGSVSPFVGLFGTVWGIMHAFTGIAAANNSSIQAVAPGIAEALFATAIGLFAAIPAVIAYNRLGHRINRIEAALGRFADGFHAMLSRELDQAR